MTADRCCNDRGASACFKAAAFFATRGNDFLLGNAKGAATATDDDEDEERIQQHGTARGEEVQVRGGGVADGRRRPG